jgi:hypothetical protein
MARFRVVFLVGALGDDLVAEEASGISAGIGNQSFLERACELQVFLQPIRYLFSDFLSFCPAANEPKKGVIRVTNILQTPVVWVLRVS